MIPVMLVSFARDAVPPIPEWLAFIIVLLCAVAFVASASSADRAGRNKQWWPLFISLIVCAILLFAILWLL